MDSHVNEELGIELLRVNARGKEPALVTLPWKSRKFRRSIFVFLSAAPRIARGVNE